LAEADPLATLGPALATEPVARCDFDALMVPADAPSDVLPVAGEGVWLQDIMGRRYLDFTSGNGVTSLGHAHPAVLQALQRQAGRLWYIGNGLTNEPVLRLARALTSLSFAERVFITNSGAEANEAAVKLARKHHAVRGTGRSRIVSCLASFEGCGTRTALVDGHVGSVARLAGNISQVNANDIAAAVACIGDDVCAVVVEPVQVHGVANPPDAEYLRTLRRLCDEQGALLIFDEVRCGLGRTGRLFAHEHAGVTPDILTIAKALGNGFPVGAMLTRCDVAAACGPGTLATTCGGNPLACAVALAAVECIARPRFLQRVREAGDRLRDGLEALCTAFPELFAQVHGCGLMLGLVFAEGQRGRAKEFVRQCERQHLLVLTAGPGIVRLLPALLVSDGEIDEALGRLRTCAADLAAHAHGSRPHA
jgi:acetylornithine/succinyldiaminopimelate/putrescine aminotransferase